jgi:hypothetical protein
MNRSPTSLRLASSVLLLALCRVASAQLTSLETDDLRLLYFEPHQSFLAPHVARCFHNSLDFHRQLFDYEPWEEITVLLTDFSDSGNAAAGTVPRNNVSIEVAPLDFAYETISGNERMNWIMNHELVHIAAMDQASSSDRFFRRLFGGKVTPVAEHPETMLYFYLTTPRVSVPRWYSEGIATFIETWMAGGIGRAQGSYDEMVFRSMVRDGSRFYDPVGLVSEGRKIDFQVETNSYLYGTRFLSYLAYRYSPELLIQWVSRSDGSRRYFASQFKRVFGAPLEQVWQEWIAWEQEFQRANLEAIRTYPTTPYQDLTERALGSISRSFIDTERRKLYAAFNYPGVVAHIGAISLDDGSIERIIDIKDPVVFTVTSLAFDPDTGTLFYTTDNHEHRDVRRVDPETGESATLLKDARVGDLAFNRVDRSLWGVRHLNGIATLVRIPYPYDTWQQVHSWPYGEVIYHIDVSPDGRRLSASLGEINGRHSLHIMEIDRLLEGDPTSVAEVDFGTTIPANFVFSPDGRFLYGSTYYTGVSNIFRYEPDTYELKAVSNCETGFFRPLPLGEDSLIVFRYSGDGFVPSKIEARPLEDAEPITFLGRRIVEKHPVVREWKVGSPADIDLEAMVTNREPYKPIRRLGLESLYPIIEGYKDSAAIGLRINLSDPLRLNRAFLTLSYSPDEELASDERLHAHLEYRRYDWRASFKYNYANFYDLFGPTKRSRKGYSLGVGYDRLLLLDRPRRLNLSLDTTFFGNMDQLPGYQNVEATFDELLTATARLTYSNVRSSLGHVDDEKGWRGELVVRGQRADGEPVPAVLGKLDLGLALPLGHSSIWLRNAGGITWGDPDDTLASFYFGGFGNNWVDHLEVKRYREFYALPGADLNEIAGQNFAKTMLEWNLPPLRFRHIGGSGLYLTWARTALFATALVTDLDAENRRVVRNVGMQIDFQLTSLSRLGMTLSFGYAVAFESDFPNREEIMASLKIF